jgi:ABC-2 type transport system permease protein/sodium transport system permease protein
VLYNEQNSWGDLIRRPPAAQSAATPSTALWSLALMTPTFFVLEGVLRSALPPSLPAMIGGMTVLGAILFVGWPVLLAWHERVLWRSGFGLRRSTWRAWLAAILLGTSVWVLALPVLSWLHPAPSDSLREALDQAMAALRQGDQRLRILLIAALMTQAVVEEAFFRGYLWAAIVRHAGTVWTLLLTSVLFGAAHVVMGGPLGLEKLLPTTLLGLLLGLVRWRTGSVAPGMLQHALHNAFLVGVGQSDVSRQADALPWPWLAAAGVATLGGAWLLAIAERGERGTSVPRGTGSRANPDEISGRRPSEG